MPDKEGDIVKEFTPHFFFVDESLLRTPPMAVRQVKLEIERMASVAMHNFDLAIEMITDLNFEKEQEFTDNEKQLNFLNRQLVNFIVRLNTAPLREEDHVFLTSAIRVTSDVERVGDYAENITEYAHIMANADARFSDKALEEILIFNDGIDQIKQFNQTLTGNR